MSYARFFRAGQKIRLRPLEPAPPPDRSELLTSYLHASDAEHFELRLPYGNDPAEQYPFETGMGFELSTDAVGLGLRITGTVAEVPGPERVRLRLNHDLQALQRRLDSRVDTRLEVRFNRSRGNLRSMRALWHKNVELIRERTDFSKLEKFSLCEVDVSAGGVRFAFKPPVAVADLVLMLMRLPDDPRPLCILAEIVWVAKIPADAPLCGMQFLCITEGDRHRLGAYVTQAIARGKPEKRKP